MWNPPNREFFKLVWLIVKQIPQGKVSSYGQIASMIPPTPGSDPQQHHRLRARWVGTAMRSDPDEPIPWQRVINSQGTISLKGITGDEQRERLESEGVTFSNSGRVDFNVYGWEGPSDDFLDEHDLLPPTPLGKPGQPKLF